MDVLYFLKDRTRIIRQYYEQAALPFSEILRRIEAEEEPYIPTYSEDGEPPFLDEWIEAGELLDITGRCCISMLSASLQLYFRTWEYELGLNCSEICKATFKTKGLIAGYRACLAKAARIDWSCCPADLPIIEQVVLARNRDQHPENITTVRVTHAKKDWKKYTQPFFLSEREMGLFRDGETPGIFMTPVLHISRDKLMTAVKQVECLCEWLEDQLLDAKYPSRKRRD